VDYLSKVTVGECYKGYILNFFLKKYIKIIFLIFNFYPYIKIIKNYIKKIQQNFLQQYQTRNKSHSSSNCSLHYQVKLIVSPQKKQMPSKFLLSQLLNSAAE
jgi:hypothetical protein